ncbi:MAG: BON domain-containing protein [Methylocystaceae bacterium]|nr:BON domain-containing protein [Methylocystaceae bacterium]
MITRFSFFLFLGLTLASCTPIGMLVTAGTTAGTFAMEERGIKGVANDMSLKADVIGKWAKEDFEFATDLSVIVYNSKAMITGSVETEEQRAQAIAMVWQVEGIKDVYNEIILKKDSSLQDFAHDTWIDAELFADTTFDSQLMQINYKYNVEGGTVYVIGLAQSKAELNRFIAHAKSVSYVKKVVTHVDIKPQKSMFREKPKQTEMAK